MYSLFRGARQSFTATPTGRGGPRLGRTAQLPGAGPRRHSIDGEAGDQSHRNRRTNPISLNPKPFHSKPLRRSSRPRTNPIEANGASGRTRRRRSRENRRTKETPHSTPPRREGRSSGATGSANPWTGPGSRRRLGSGPTPIHGFAEPVAPRTGPLQDPVSVVFSEECRTKPIENHSKAIPTNGLRHFPA